MANSLLSEGEVDLRHPVLPPIAKRLIPSLAEKPKLFAGLDAQGYVIVNSMDDTYIGYSDDGSVSQSIEFQTDDYGDACIDLSRSFVSVTVRTQMKYGDSGNWTEVDGEAPVTLANGGGQLAFSRATIQINNQDVGDDADSVEDGAALSGFVQMAAQMPASSVRGGRMRVWGIPTLVDADGLECNVGYYFPGEAAVDPTTGGTPRCVSTAVGQAAGNEEGWALCDDRLSDEGDVSLGENSVYPVGQSRGSGALSLMTSFSSGAGAGDPRGTFRYRPSSALWRQGVCLPAGSRLNMRLFKSRAQRFIRSQWWAAGPTVGKVSETRVLWEKCSLWLWTVRPRTAILTEIRRALAAEKFLVPLIARRIFAAQPATGTTSFSASGLFPGVQPARVWVWLTRSHQQSGMSVADLARFSPYAMSSLGQHSQTNTTAPAANQWQEPGANDQIPDIITAQMMTPDGRTYPENGYNNPLAVDENLRRYSAYLTACDDPNTPAISYRHYCLAYPFLVFDINQQTTGVASDQLDTSLGVPLPYNQEGLTLNLQFNSGVVNTPATGDSLPPLWVVAVAESAAGLLFSGGPDGLQGGGVAVKRIGY